MYFTIRRHTDGKAVDREGRRRGEGRRGEPRDLGPPRHLHRGVRRREGDRDQRRPPARQDAGRQGHSLRRVRIHLQARRREGPLRPRRSPCRVRRRRELVGTLRLRLDKFCLAFAGDDRGAGEADEEAALEGAGDVFDLYLERRRVGDLVEGAVCRVVAAVRDEGARGLRPVHPQLGLATEGGEGFEGALPPEGVDLDRQGAGAQRVDQLARVGDNDEALFARGGHDLLPEERASPSLDEDELWGDLIGPVYGKARTGLRERRQRYAQLVRQGGGLGRSRYAPDIFQFSRGHQVPDPAHRESG